MVTQALGSGKSEMWMCKQKLAHSQVNLAEKGELFAWCSAGSALKTAHCNILTRQFEKLWLYSWAPFLVLEQ